MTREQILQWIDSLELPARTPDLQLESHVGFFERNSDDILHIDHETFFQLLFNAGIAFSRDAINNAPKRTVERIYKIMLVTNAKLERLEELNNLPTTTSEPNDIEKDIATLKNEINQARSRINSIFKILPFFAQAKETVSPHL